MPIHDITRKGAILSACFFLTGCDGIFEDYSCKKEMSSFSASSCSAFDSGSYHSRTCRAWNSGKSYTYIWDDDDKLPGANSNGCRVSSFSFTPLDDHKIYDVYKPPPTKRYFCTSFQKALYGKECVS